MTAGWNGPVRALPLRRAAAKPACLRFLAFRLLSRVAVCDNCKIVSFVTLPNTILTLTRLIGLDSQVTLWNRHTYAPDGASRISSTRVSSCLQPRRARLRRRRRLKIRLSCGPSSMGCG